MKRTPRTLLVGAGAILAIVGLAGCVGGSPTPSATPTATTTVTRTAAPIPTTTPTGGGGSAGSGDGRCTTDHLSGQIVDDGGGAAGSVEVAIALTNTGSSSCTLQGWPGVSLVGDGNGTQLGAAATFTRSSPHPTVTLAPGAVAKAPLSIVQAANFPTAACSPQAADGFRVYPPGETGSLYIADAGVTACTNPASEVLSVSGFVAG